MEDMRLDRELLWQLGPKFCKDGAKTGVGSDERVPVDICNPRFSVFLDYAVEMALKESRQLRNESKNGPKLTGSKS